jgi:3-oxoacyl-[acyl-carrier protein] reductase
MFNDFTAIKVGDIRSLSKKITESEVEKFVNLTGDNNPLHVDKDYAQRTSFKDIVVHGMLGASFISTVIGTKLPGPGALWVSQSIEFLRPVRLNDYITISCKVIKKVDRDRLLDIETTITNQNNEIVLEGKGRVKVLEEKTIPNLINIKEFPRVALVTGASGGIGEEICLKLAANGYNIFVAYNNNVKSAEQLCHKISELGCLAIPLKTDLKNYRSFDTLINACINELGGVSVLVNNASPPINPKSLHETNWDDFQNHLDIQVKASFELIKRCAPYMREYNWGRIVNITSQAIEANPTTHWTSYAVAKGALSTMSRYIANELGASGITVNCVAPGMTDTTLIGDIPEKLQLMVARQTPMRRLSLPVDVAAAVAFLISDEASFITGHTLSVNGGMSMK